MSLPLRLYIALLLAPALLLGGCGFQPVYAQRAEAFDTLDMLAAIQIKTPAGRQGDQLKAELQDRFNPESIPTMARYELEAQIELISEPFIIEPDGTASRFRVTIQSPFTLKRLSDHQVINSGTVRYQVSYNVSETDDYSTVMSQGDAIKRGITELSEDYKMRISGVIAREITR